MRDPKRARPRLERVCAILALASLLGCAHHASNLASAPLVPQAPQAGHMHKVAKGETLYRIALHEGVAPAAIAEENGLRDGAALEVGQTLFIPAVHAARANPATEGNAETPRLLWPVRGVIFSTFGHRGSEHHDGLDLAAPEGTTIVAAADGTVLFAGEQRGYGEILLIQHAGDLVTVYAHNRENLARQGDRVVRGQPIARVGRTGNATGPHVHFEVRVAARPQDPLEFLR